MLSLEVLQGNEAKKHLHEIATLRMQVFAEFPYLYDGDLDYEKKYLDRYFSSQNSLVVCLWDEKSLVGASTAIHLPEEAPMIRSAFEKFKKFPLSEVVYFGESILNKKYRGLGYGKKFFEEREKFAKSIKGVFYTSFCAVIREINDPRRPKDYFSPDILWKKLNYAPVPGLKCTLEWKEHSEEKDTPKELQFWIKKII
jgi:GNAT superfamily N-acetyltransferase